MNHHRRLTVAVLVDVDGTLVGPYRASTCALRLLAQQAPVFLWSMAGAENGQRLLKEYPALKPLIAGSYGKEDFPLHLIERPIAIDDEEVDDVVLSCDHIILGETYEGGQTPALYWRLPASSWRRFNDKAHVRQLVRRLHTPRAAVSFHSPSALQMIRSLSIF